MNNYIVLIDMRPNPGKLEIVALSYADGEIKVFHDLEEIHEIHNWHSTAELPWAVLDIDDMEVVETIF